MENLEQTPAETVDTQDKSEETTEEVVAEETVAEEPAETVESLKSKYEEAQRKISEVSERAARQDELLRMSYDMIKKGTDEKVPEVNEEDELDKIIGDIPMDKVMDDPASVQAAFKSAMKKVYHKAKDDSKRELTQEYVNAQESSASGKKVVDMFYSANKDLKGQEELVDVYSYQVGHEYPNWSVEHKLQEIATRTRNKIASIRKGTAREKPENLEGAGGQGGSPKVKPIVAQKGAKEQIEDYFAERKKEQQKKMVV